MRKDDIGEYMAAAKHHVLETRCGERQRWPNQVGEAAIVWPNTVDGRLSWVGAPPYRIGNIKSVPTAEVMAAMREAFDGSVFRSFSGGERDGTRFDDYARLLQNGIVILGTVQWHCSGFALIAYGYEMLEQRITQGVTLRLVDPTSAAYAKYDTDGRNRRDLEAEQAREDGRAYLENQREEWRRQVGQYRDSFSGPYRY